MGADIDHAAGKSLVSHRRHCDQHLAVEIATLAGFMPKPRSAGFCPSAFRGISWAARHIGFGSGMAPVAVLRSWLATELHAEMLPDWRPFANDEMRAKLMHTI